MNTHIMRFSGIALMLGMAALAGGLAASALAQDAGTTARPISLNLVNVPIQAALRTLFSSAGIRNYSIKSDVQGFANINVSDVSFSLALRQLLGSVNPPLTYTIIDGTYMVSVQQAPQTVEPQIVLNAPPVTEETADKRFYTIPINSYDAFVIAKLLADTGKIIQVPVNVVIPSGGSTGGGNPSGGFGGNLSAPVTTLGNGSFQGGVHYTLR